MDSSNIKKHIDLLGLSNKSITLLSFFHKEHPNYANDKGRKITGRIDQLLPKIERFEREGRGIHIVVNGEDGNISKNIAYGRAMFLEHDDLPKEEQIEIWKKLNLPEPTFQVDTKGRSIHSYWVFDQPVPSESWHDLQARLLAYTDADRSLGNINHPMRLAGTIYDKSQETVCAEIITTSGKKYNPKDFGFLPKVEIKKIGNSADNTSVPVPLEEFLSKEDRRDLQYGAKQGSRNSTAYRLAANLIGTSKRLEYLGILYSGNPYQLFVSFCQRCSQGEGWQQSEWDKVWQSAKDDNPTATLDDEYLENCQKAYIKRRERSLGKEQPVPSSKVKTNEASESLIRSTIEDLLSLDLNNSTLSYKIHKLAQETGWQERTLRRIYYEQAEEIQKKDYFEESLENFEKIQELKQFRPDYYRIFPHELAHPLVAKADSDRIDPIMLVQNFWGAIGCCAGSKAGLVAKDHGSLKDRWIEYPVFFSVIVGGVSTGKSLSNRAIFGPLKEKQTQENIRHREATRQWEEIQEAWGLLSRDQKEELKDTPQNPRVFREQNLNLKKWIFDDATVKAALKRLSKQEQTKGTVWVRDELSGLFKSFNAYYEGDDQQEILEIWSGKIVKSVDRATDENCRFLAGQTINITGGIQPQVIREYLNLKDEGDGLASRFLLAIAQEPANYAVWSDVAVDISSVLSRIYDRIESLPNEEQHIYFSPQAYERWKRYWETLRKVQQRYKYSNSAYSGYVGKLISYLARLALALHLIDWALSDDEQLCLQCPAETLDRAWELIKYYAKQFLLIQQQTSSEAEDAAGGLLADIWEVCQREGKISTRTIQRLFSRRKVEGKKIDSKIAFELMQCLERKGLGKIQKIRNSKVLICHQCQQSVNGSIDSSKALSNKDFEVVSSVSSPNQSSLEKVDQPTHSPTYRSEVTSNDSNSGSSHSNGSRPSTQPSTTVDTVDTTNVENLKEGDRVAILSYEQGYPGVEAKVLEVADKLVLLEVEKNISFFVEFNEVKKLDNRTNRLLNKLKDNFSKATTKEEYFGLKAKAGNLFPVVWRKLSETLQQRFLEYERS